MFINRYLLAYAKGNLFRISLTTILQLVITLLSTIITMSLAILVKLLLTQNKVLIYSETWQVFLTIGICLILRFFISKVKAVEAEKTGILIKDNTRSWLLQKLFMLGPQYTNTTRTGTIASTVTSKVEWLKQYYTSYIPIALAAMINGTIILIMIFFIDYVTAIVCLIAMIGMLGCPMLFYKIMRERGKKEWEEHAKYYGDCLDGIQGIASLKAFNANDKQLEKMKNQGEKFRLAIMSHLKVTMVEGGVLELFARIGGALSVGVAAIRFVDGHIESNMIIYIFYLASACFFPMFDLINAWHIGFHGVAASYSIGDLINTPVKYSLYKDTNGKLLTHSNLEDIVNDRVESSLWNKQGKENFTGDIKFRNISFAYNNEDGEVLKNVSFSIPHGTMTALVGPSGSGKSTIAHILAGFYPANSGSVMVGDLELSETTLAKIQNYISVVWQDCHLFYGTVYDNIIIGKPDSDEEEVIAAAREANIHDFIVSLPDGYNTIIGERGLRFSGGERQRISIARAYLRNAPIIIFDEATSSLDRKNEIEIQKSFKKLSKGKTSLVIAHRLATIQHADQICIIDKGRLLESGTHQELTQKSQLYLNLMGDQISVKEGD